MGGRAQESGAEHWDQSSRSPRGSTGAAASPLLLLLVSVFGKAPFLSSSEPTQERGGSRQEKEPGRCCNLFFLLTLFHSTCLSTLLTSRLSSALSLSLARSLPPPVPSLIGECEISRFGAEAQLEQQEQQAALDSCLQRSSAGARSLCTIRDPADGTVKFSVPGRAGGGRTVTNRSLSSFLCVTEMSGSSPPLHVLLTRISLGLEQMKLGCNTSASQTVLHYKL